MPSSCLGAVVMGVFLVVVGELVYRANLQQPVRLQHLGLALGILLVVVITHQLVWFIRFQLRFGLREQGETKKAP